MSANKSLFRFSIWYLLLVCLLVAAVTWWWFERKIDTIDDRIESMYR